MGKIRYGVLGASEDDALFSVDGLRFTQDGSDYGVARFLYESKDQGEYLPGHRTDLHDQAITNQGLRCRDWIIIFSQYRRMEVRRQVALGY